MFPVFRHPFPRWNTSSPIHGVLFQSIILNQSINFYVLILYFFFFLIPPPFPFWSNERHGRERDLRRERLRGCWERPVMCQVPGAVASWCWWEWSVGGGKLENESRESFFPLSLLLDRWLQNPCNAAWCFFFLITVMNGSCGWILAGGRSCD